MVDVLQQDPLAFRHSLRQRSWLPHKLPWDISAAVHPQQHLEKTQTHISAQLIITGDLKYSTASLSQTSPESQSSPLLCSLTLLSVWSPSWTLRISVAFVCPVTAAINSTRAVLPHPIGPSRSTGFWEATASASLLRLRQVESTSTRSFWFTYERGATLWISFFFKTTGSVSWDRKRTCSVCLGAVLGSTTPHTATTFWERSSDTTWPLVNLLAFSWRHITEPWLAKTRAFSTSTCWVSSKALNEEHNQKSS